MTTQPSIAALREIGPSFAARSAEFEQLRQLPEDVTEALLDLDVLRCWIPRRYIGHELPVAQGLALIEELSYWDSAIGWCAMISATTAVQSAFLPEKHARAIYGDNPRVITCGVAEPRGIARAVDGGLEVEGTWSWGSGTFHSDWIGAGCRVEGEAAPVFVFFEREQVELLDTWHVTGLKGTGSTDYRVVKAFVPEGRWVRLNVDRSATVASSLYQFPTFGLLAVGVTVVGLGIARRAIDEFKEIAEQKKYVGSSRAISNRPMVLATVAEAEARLYSARAFVDQAVEQACLGSDQDSVTLEQRRRLRMAATFGMRNAVAVVDSMFQLAGGTSVYERCPLQRLARDVQVAATHGMVAPRTYEMIGRKTLGLDTHIAQL